VLAAACAGIGDHEFDFCQVFQVGVHILSSQNFTDHVSVIV
jgi:hypothetical protein